MAGRLLEFGEELRGEGVAIGTSELLDAFVALQHVPWTEQGDFREALAATLAKSQDDRRGFELVFDRFFFRAAELAAIEEGVREEGGISPEQAGALDMEELRRQVAQAVRDGNEGLMRSFPRLAAGGFARWWQGSGAI